MAVGEELKMRGDPHRWNSVLKEWISLDPTQGPKTRETEARDERLEESKGWIELREYQKLETVDSTTKI